MTTWTNTAKSQPITLEIDFIFSDDTDFLFSNGDDYVFLETAGATWSSLSKNTTTWTALTKS